MTVQYCLPRKSQLLMNHVYNDNLNLRKHFKVSKATFQKLCVMVRTGKDHGWPERLEVLVFLYWLASGAAYRMVAVKFGIPRSTVNDIIHRILGRLLQQLRHVIYLPRQNEIPSICQAFAQITGVPDFNRIVGCLDCFHVGIKPPKTLEQYYINEKLYYSVKCQIVCDHNGLIRDIFVGFPGSVHDSQVLSLSPLYSKGFFPPPGHFLLADNAYPCSESPIGIVTPFHEPTQSGLESRFNAIHRKAWLVARKTIVGMKARWHRVFGQNLDASNRIAPKVIAACAIMHNVSILTGDMIVASFDAQNVIMDVGSHPTENSEFRKHLAQQLSAQMCTPTLPDHSYIN